MTGRDNFIARMKAQLEEGKAELHRLEARARDAQADIREKYHHTAEELHRKRLTAEAKLDTLRHAGEEAWEAHRDEVEKTWDAFKAGLDAFRDFSDHA